MRARPTHAPLNAEQRRNYLLTVANGSLVMMGFTFIAFDSILAGLAYELTESTLCVGLLVTGASIGWLWPQLLVGNRIEHRERKMPLYRATISARLGAMAVMLVAVLVLSGAPALLYGTILVCAIVMSSAGGVCSIPFMDIVAKAIPAEHRSMLFAWRRLLGGLLGFFAGLIAARVLSDNSPVAYPYNYAVIIGCGMVGMGVAYFSFTRVREPIEPVESKPRPFTEFLRGGFALFAEDRDFRLLYFFRVFHSLGLMSQILLVPFVMDVFGAHVETTGLFAATMALAGGLSSMVWGRISKRFGEVWTFRVATALLVLTPLSMLTMAVLAGHEVTRTWIAAHYLWVCLFLLAAYTGGRCGTDMANMVYLMSMAPSEKRPIYMAMMNTLSAPLVLFPTLAGGLVALTSYGATFAVSCVCLVLALAVAFGMSHRRI